MNDLRNILDPLNREMAIVWQMAVNKDKIASRRNKDFREAIRVSIIRICDDLIRLLGSSHPDCRTFYRASMVASGSLRVYEMQIYALLDDIKDLLKKMKREKRIMKIFDDNIDDIHSQVTVCQRGVLDELVPEGDFGASPRHFQTFDAPNIAEIDWSEAVSRARLQDITITEVDDAVTSQEYQRELGRLHAEERELDGPTLLDWLGWESFKEEETATLEKVEEEAVRLRPEAPAMEAVPEDQLQQEQLPVPEVMECVPEQEPRAQELAPEEAEPTEAVIQPPHEEPSQIELQPLGDRKQTRRYRRKGRGRRGGGAPMMDRVIFMNSDAFRQQLTSSYATLRAQTAYEDIISLRETSNLDITLPCPLRHGPMAEALLDMFRERGHQAPFPDPEPQSPQDEGRAGIPADQLLTTYSAIEDVSTDTSAQPSRSTLLEAHTGLFEETQPLQPIGEVETLTPHGHRTLPRSPTLPIPQEEVPLESEAIPAPAPQPDRDVDIGVPAEDDIQPAPVEVPPPRVESESSETSLVSRQSIYEDTERKICDCLGDIQQVTFCDLLPEDATKEEAVYIFSVLLGMHKDGLVVMQQRRHLEAIIIIRPVSQHERATAAVGVVPH